jgi:hypothetical protein
MKFVRDILIAVEGCDVPDGGLAWMNLNIHDRTEQEIVFHINLLAEAGYLKLTNRPNDPWEDDPFPLIARMTMLGYDFYGHTKSANAWAWAKDTALKAAGTITIGTLLCLTQKYISGLAGC